MVTSYDDYVKKREKDKLAREAVGGVEVASGPKIAGKRPNKILLLGAVALGVVLLSWSNKKNYQTLSDAELQAMKEESLSVPATSEVRLDKLPDIDQAYRMTNVERVKFNLSTSNLYYEDKEYLNQLFVITDRLVIVRVQNFLLLSHKAPLLPLTAYDAALSDLAQMTVPEKSRESHALIVSAIKDQREYFQFLAESNGAFNQHNPLVQRSQNNLLKAWRLWLAAYANENAHNKYSFEKHLCALSFI